MWFDPGELPPFRRRDAGDYGLTDADVRRLLGNGVLERRGHGLIVGYRRPELVTEEPHEVALRAEAMQRRYPMAVVGMRTAAALHRLWLVGPVGPTQLLRERGYPRRKHDVLVDTMTLPARDLVEVEGVLATSVARTTVDLLACLPGGEALAIADSSLRTGVSLDELHRVAADFGYAKGSAVIRVLDQADALSQSALESMSRWLFLVANLPEPELQVGFGDDEGPFAEVDFLWREYGVIGEADVMLKYDEDPAAPRKENALRKEKLRQERLERLGFIVVRWDYNDIMRHPARTIARVREALARATERRTRAI
jgi:hypothetical protein